MKKQIKSLLTILVVLIAISFAGCSSQEVSTPVIENDNSQVEVIEELPPITESQEIENEIESELISDDVEIGELI